MHNYVFCAMGSLGSEDLTARPSQPVVQLRPRSPDRARHSGDGSNRLRPSVERRRNRRSARRL